MRSSQRLLALLLFAALSLLALACSGLLDWLASSLFLVLELLAEFLRRMFGIRLPQPCPVPSTDHHAGRHHRPPLAGHRPRRLVHRKGFAARKRERPLDG